MFIDSLTVTGFICAAGYALMPLMMGREFIRVDDCESAATACPPHNRREEISDVDSAIDGAEAA